ncbi:MAG TPA: SitI3 family protein [Myxococcaceae bacterium]|nr:SitI3 family protein [Myxococcaceae bacterium]
MSLDYSFHISTTLGPETLMRTFLLSLGLPWDPKDPCSTDAPRFTAGVGPLPLDSREFRQEQFGFAPDQYFVFRTWSAYSVEAKAEIVRGTLAICQSVPGDAVLLFNGEIVLFMRKAGTLYVNSAYFRGDYSLFTPPYELKAFEVL